MEDARLRIRPRPRRRLNGYRSARPQTIKPLAHPLAPHTHRCTLQAEEESFFAFYDEDVVGRFYFLKWVSVRATSPEFNSGTRGHPYSAPAAAPPDLAWDVRRNVWAAASRRVLLGGALDPRPEPDAVQPLPLLRAREASDRHRSVRGLRAGRHRHLELRRPRGPHRGACGRQEAGKREQPCSRDPLSLCLDPHSA